METAPELDLDAGIFLRNKSSLNIKQNRSDCKHKGVQDHNKYTLEDYKYCLESRDFNVVLIILLELINMKFQW